MLLFVSLVYCLLLSWPGGCERAASRLLWLCADWRLFVPAVWPDRCEAAESGERETGPGARDFSPGHSGAASEVTRRERRDSACVGDHDMTDTRTRTSSDIQINERTRGQD